MPPALHPRSRQTASLFTATLAVSFIVVGLPHILPCPVPTRAFADAAAPDGGQRQRRRRRKCGSEGEEAAQAPVATRQISAGEEAPSCAGAEDGGLYDAEEAEDLPRSSVAGRKRECPVPKPGGLVGQILGFEKEERRPRSVIVESVRARRSRVEEGRE